MFQMFFVLFKHFITPIINDILRKKKLLKQLAKFKKVKLVEINGKIN